MEKNGKQLWYSQETINEAFHFLCIYSKDKEQLKPQALHTKWEKQIIIYVQPCFLTEN